jgi:hypothetical protein
MSPAAQRHHTIEGRRGSRIDLEEGGRYLGIPRNRSCASVHDCPGNRVRYTLSFWKWKLAREAGGGPGRAADLPARPAAPPTFVPIQLGSPRAPRAVGESTAERDGAGEVEIALGRRGLVRVHGRVDPAWLVAVVRGLEGLGC